MTEQDYINVRDLSNVMHADAMVRDITIENQPNIAKAEYQAVLKTLVEWRSRLFAAVHKTMEHTDEPST